MLKVGLTGNIGSGKSVVAGIFSMLGVPVFQADTEARKQFENDKTRIQLREVFGPGIFAPTGDVLRQVLAEIVFNDPEKLQELNNIIHPAVRRDYRQWCLQHLSAPYSLYEAAILFESGYNRELDKVICVTAPKELRIKRVMERDGLSLKEIERRMANQWEEERKVALSDFVIRNDESSMVITQVLEIHNKIVKSLKY